MDNKFYKRVCHHQNKNCSYREVSLICSKASVCPYDLVPLCEEDWLPEQLQTVKNLTEAAQIIYKNNKKLLPTVLELLYMEVQQIIDENCVEKGESS